MVNQALARARTVVGEDEDRCIVVQFLCRGAKAGRSRPSRGQVSKRCVEGAAGRAAGHCLTAASPVGPRVFRCAAAPCAGVDRWYARCCCCGRWIAPAHALAWLHREVLQVCKQRLPASAMINHDNRAVVGAIGIGVRGGDHGAVGGASTAVPRRAAKSVP